MLFDIRRTLARPFPIGLPPIPFIRVAVVYNSAMNHRFSSPVRYARTTRHARCPVLLLGLLRREKYGFANIGFESLLILLIYVGGTAVLLSGV